MGKRGRRGGGARFYRNKKVRGEGNGNNDAWRQDKSGEDGYTDFVFTNENFIKFYQAQGVVGDDEWDEFMKFLAKPLPTSFRINNSCAFADRIRERIQNDFKFDGLVVDDEEVEPIAEMPWYPDHKGFHWSVERRRIRKLEILSDFQKWLVELSDSGNITRQEAVSMIPPLVLGVEPHHRVLDMCAAPGSKTSQLLESLHAQEAITGETPTGMVVANDVDLKRAFMLVHQSKRIGSPALVVTCHEAQKIPFLGGEAEKQNGFFDRVLCDAPCSGDGTLRKNPMIWKNWDAKNGLALHPLQVEIAKRGASLLKVGGFMCYSTCTFNPLENEAVVAEMLRWSEGALELVDVTNVLPLLKRRPGKTTWKVLDSELKEYKTHEEFMDPANESRKNPKNRIRATMFPPTAEEVAKFNLERCMRCVPQDENTGGFFICLFKKTAPTPENEVVVYTPAKGPRANRAAAAATSEVEAVVDADDAAIAAADASAEVVDADVDAEENAENAVAVADDEEDVAAVAEEEKPAAEKRVRPSRRDRSGTAKGEQYIAFGEDQFKKIQECYALDDGFSSAQLITRSDESKAITFVTKSITMELLDEMKAKKLKVIYTGVKMFEHSNLSDGSKSYRLCQSGLRMALPFIHTRKIKISSRDLQMLMQRHGELLDFDEFEKETCQALTEAPLGTVVAMLDRPQQTIVENLVLNVVLWRGRNSVNLMASKIDAVAITAVMKAINLFDPKVIDEVAAAKAERLAKRAVRDAEQAQLKAVVE